MLLRNLIFLLITISIFQTIDCTKKSKKKYRATTSTTTEPQPLDANGRKTQFFRNLENISKLSAIETAKCIYESRVEFSNITVEFVKEFNRLVTSDFAKKLIYVDFQSRRCNSDHEDSYTDTLVCLQEKIFPTIGDLKVEFAKMLRSIENYVNDVEKNVISKCREEIED